MNLSQNFIKLLFACGTCVFIAACDSSLSGRQNASPPPASAPVFNQTAPTGKLTPSPSLALTSSHGEKTENNPGKELVWRLVDGRRQTFVQYRGKAVILDFWATYCPPCEEEIPHLVELSDKYGKDLHVVGLHVGGDEDKPNVAGFVAKYKMSYDLGYPEQDLTDFYLEGDDRIPQTLVFDREGRLVQKFVGFTPEIKEQLNQAVQTAVSR